MLPRKWAKANAKDYHPFTEGREIYTYGGFAVEFSDKNRQITFGVDDVVSSYDAVSHKYIRTLVSVSGFNPDAAWRKFCFAPILETKIWVLLGVPEPRWYPQEGK